MLEKIFIIKSDKNKIPEVVGKIISTLNQTSQIRDDNLFRVKIVLNEIIANSIIHGNCLCESKQVVIKMELDDELVLFKIIDQGESFDGFDETCDNLLKESNRGLLICKSMCDEISYKFARGVGNQATIKFYKLY